MTRPQPPAPLVARRSVLGALAVAALRLFTAGAGVSMARIATAADAQLAGFELTRDEDGVYLSYAVDFELGRGVDDALAKAVPLFFVADVEVFRSRWYWRDRRVAHAVRTFRIVYQPLTSNFRVTTIGGLAQNHPTRAEALATISRASGWKIAEPGQIEEGARHYVEFTWRLDTSQLPRPMQIGISGESDWQLNVRRSQRL